MVNQVNDVQEKREERIECIAPTKKSISVHKEDYEYIKTWSFNRGVNMIDTVSVFVGKMKAESIEEIKKELKFMYFIDEEHKSNFANFLDERSYKEKYDGRGSLVAYYANAIPSIATGNYFRTIGLFEWMGRFSEEKNEFVPSEKFLALSKGEQIIVSIAKSFFDSSAEFNISNGIKKLESSYYPLIQEMIRLKMLGIASS